MPDKILIIGATGTVGREVVGRLVNHEVHLFAGVRSLGKAETFQWENVAIRNFDYLKPETFKAALKEIDKVFLIPPPSPLGLSELMPFLEVAKEQDLKHLVYISGMSVENHPELMMRQIEIAVETMGIPYTCLRPNWFMQNFLTYFRDDVLQGQINLPAGSGRVSFIDVRDIACAAERALLSDSFYDQAFTLTGPKALSFADAADVLSSHLSTKVSYRSISEDEAEEHFLRLGWPKENIDELLQLFDMIKTGEQQFVSSDVEEILGRPPISFDQFVREHAKKF